MQITQLINKVRGTYMLGQLSGALLVLGVVVGTAGYTAEGIALITGANLLTVVVSNE